MTARVFEAGTNVGGTWHWNRYPVGRFFPKAGPTALNLEAVLSTPNTHMPWTRPDRSREADHFWESSNTPVSQPTILDIP